MSRSHAYPFVSGATPGDEEIRAWLSTAAAAAYGAGRASELAGAIEATAAKLARLARLGDPPAELAPDVGR